MFRDALRRPRPDKVIWSVAFVLFALAAGAEVVGSTWGWSEWLARTYYGAAAALVVAYLAIGQLYLLFPVAMRRFGVGATLLITALWLSLVASADVDTTKLEADGWRALDRGSEIIATSVVIDSLGTLIIVGGTAWSVWRFRKLGTHRNRMIGCALICIGTMVVAAGGSLTRLGNEEYLYIAMAVGVALIFWGVVQTRRPESGVVSVPAAETGVNLSRGPESPVVNAGGATSAVAFIEHLIARDDAEVDRVCTEWSVARDETPVLTRSDARRAWRLRTQLEPAAIDRFDRLPVAARRQLATLYHDVLSWERPTRDEIAELVTPESGTARHA
jgi:hypothetical protein